MPTKKQNEESQEFWNKLKHIFIENNVDEIDIEDIDMELDEDDLFFIKSDITKLVVDDFRDKGIL